jgi:D-alanyl-D-alanine carboxypeptidase
MRRALLNREAVPMMNDVPPSGTISVRIRLLSVTGLAVVASLLIWHSQLSGLLDRPSGADEQPVVSGSGVPRGTAPPVSISPDQTRPASTSTSTSKATSVQTTKPSTTPTAQLASYDESSAEGLTSKLRQRLKRATAAAARDGITVRITSGRRSVAKQRKLLNEAIVKYGSRKAAMRWVLPPEYSAHVKGRAVDIGPRAAMSWMNKNGWRYGICRRYDNEPWHFEALTSPGMKCPAREPYATPTSD